MDAVVAASSKYDYPLEVAGHSLGASLSLSSAYMYAGHPFVKIKQVVTFNPGISVLHPFKDASKRALANKVTTHLRIAGDMVSFFPPQFGKSILYNVGDDIVRKGGDFVAKHLLKKFLQEGVETTYKRWFAKQLVLRARENAEKFVAKQGLYLTAKYLSFQIGDIVFFFDPITGTFHQRINNKDTDGYTVDVDEVRRLVGEALANAEGGGKEGTDGLFHIPDESPPPNPDPYPNPNPNPNPTVGGYDESEEDEEDEEDTRSEQRFNINTSGVGGGITKGSCTKNAKQPATSDVTF